MVSAATTLSSKIRSLRPYLTLANGISLFRATLAFPIVQTLNQWDGKLTHFPFWAGFWIALAVLSDFLDGWYARSYRSVSRIGKMLDPIADKVVVFSVLLFARRVSSRLPTWFVIMVIVRDLLIAAVGLFVTRRSKRDLQANRPGKFSINFTSAAILLKILQVEPWGTWALWGAVVLNVVSFMLYMRTYYIYYIVEYRT